jgi:formylglycine-generating enzyme required for sulfatase activity
MRRAPAFIALGQVALLVLATGCKESCPTTSDLGGPAADLGGSIDQASWPNCKKDKVQCAAGEINAFGLCQGAAAMVRVAAGQFPMGSNEPGQPFNPEHRVTLKEFYIDVTEVTVAAYKACVDCGACKRPLRDGSNTGREPYFGNQAFANHPVIYVSWQDAKGYCEAIGKRLPTEAEWEMAARGPQGNVYPWGADAPSSVTANFGGMVNDTQVVTCCGGGKSPAGALNMAGNVWEWVSDSFDPSYYAVSPATDPKGPPGSVVKVARGGGFNSSAETLKSYYRIGYAETAAFSYLGFRCAKDTW